MPKTPRIYRRLTRPTSSVGTYNSLWLAADHLLVVKSNGYTEDYQRIQLREIKGFFLIAGKRRLYWGLAWGVVLAISGLVIISAMTSNKTPVASVFFFVPALIIFVANIIIGPGCRTFVVTGVQTAVLPSLVRQPKARKILRRLDVLIREAQKDLQVQPAASVEEPPLV